MKILNKITIVGAVLLTMVSISCNKDFLDKQPLTALASQTFWKSKNDVDMGVIGCYARLKGTFLDYRRGYLDGLSDNGYAAWGWFGIESYALGAINANGGEVRNIFYAGCYAGVGGCNFFMDNVDLATTVDQSIVNVAKGEVRFLRALFYFELVNCFGDVILYKTTPKNADESKIAKSPKADVFKFIEEDLDFAIANLPDNAYTSGHAVKGSAMALKTRVLLTEGKWSEAATLSKQIIDGGKFSIYKDYATMFFKPAQLNNPEIMFSCDYLAPTAIHSQYGMNMEYTISFFLSKDLFDAWECKDGKSISESPLYDPAHPFNNREPRFNASVRFPGENWPGYDPEGLYNAPGSYENKKMVNTSVPGSYAGALLQDQNFILLRYADVLLMYAEAKNEASGPDQSVYNAINAVRSRPSVNLPPIDQSRYNTKELVQEFIRHERRIEFAWEGTRYFDLKRWHIAHIVLPKLMNPNGYLTPLVFTEKNYYWPFAQWELDANPNLVQTTGY